MHLLFSGLRRFVRRDADRREELMYVTTSYHFNMPINLEIRQQRRCVICIQFNVKKMIHDDVGIFDRFKFLSDFCLTAARS